MNLTLTFQYLLSYGVRRTRDYLNQLKSYFSSEMERLTREPTILNIVNKNNTNVTLRNKIGYINELIY